MASWRRFQPRLWFVETGGDRGTKQGRLCGGPFKTVGATRESSTRGRGNPTSSPVESTREKSLQGRTMDVRTGNRHRWARRVASGERVKPGQGTRHTDPVTSEEGMPPRVRRTAKLEGVAANRPKRLFSKNTGACQAA